MNRDRQLDLAEKYFIPFNWYTNVLGNNLFDGKILMERIKSEYINVSGCSSDKFDQLSKKGFIDFDYELEDEPFVVIFWQIVDNIRLAHQ